MSDPAASPERLPWTGVALSGLAGGALDLTFAFLFYGTRAPARR